MRIVVSATLFIAIALGALYLLGQRTGVEAPRLTLPQLELPSGSGETVRAYKWRDGEGNWHYGDTPPPGVKAEPLDIDPDANLIPSALPQPPSDAPSLNDPIGQAREARRLLEQNPEQRATLAE